METFLYLLRRVKGLFFPPLSIHAPNTPLIAEYNVAVPMRDGVKLRVNIFRPVEEKTHPTIISFHPYGKDKLPKKGIFRYKPLISYRILRQTGRIRFSALTGWEAPDPDFWVSHGYTVINADMRGAGQSEGHLNILTQEEAEDYFELIEWAARQSWSNGKIGLCGVSYLALSQYRVASLQPPHLAAICPWEGFSDVYKDLARPGGIREDKFFVFWTQRVSPSFRIQQIEHLTRDQWWQSHIPSLQSIKTPALICASFSDQCLHSGGSFRAFTEINSVHKWLYTHRDGKWHAFYSDNALKRQLEFFDYFLMNKENGLLDRPTIRLEIRESRKKIVRIEEHNQWPLPNVNWQAFYLDLAAQRLEINRGLNQTNSFIIGKNGLSFTYQFPKDTLIVGPMKLSLFLKLESCQDLSLFAGLRKFSAGKQIFFEGSYGYGFDIVSKGWQKLSLRKLDERKSSFWHPEHPFLQIELLKKEEIARLEFALLPQATLFKAGDCMRLDLQGHWFFKPSLLMSQLSNYEQIGSGICTVLGGEDYPSQLLLPLVLC